MFYRAMINFDVNLAIDSGNITENSNIDKREILTAYQCRRLILKIFDSRKIYQKQFGRLDSGFGYQLVRLNLGQGTRLKARRRRQSQPTLSFQLFAFSLFT
jgi:hypothetical protein